MASDPSGSPLRRQLYLFIQEISSTLIILTCIPKAMRVALLIYLSLKAHILQWWFTNNTRSVKATHTWLTGIKVNQFKDVNPYYNMINHLFTPNLRSWWGNIPYHWEYKLPLRSSKPVTNWYDIYVVVIMTKTCTICGFVTYTFLQPIKCTFMT